MKNVKITKKWHQASKTIEKVPNVANTTRSGTFPTLSQPTTPHDHPQSIVYNPLRHRQHEPLSIYARDAE
ncbi:hypothetical protein GN244_ATG13454 [Phytophthora infestans]|uniref:Uncharacterized protein n=1 Tax=Phytophthora infestans TaxID=4787 RepID=A0A833WIF1_PHYIN|nr:hypothetical protein GN244_ATG19893 [Phytophthora infestans]KAF4034600.1 hypothetical protein GN244_ATG13454 [Phytophthora infestans]KAF4135502.1 hypothetical protein GN958_ATG15301 [Phytophthora infestans]KAF4136070.1 hypothetical protein GN958_ATG14740 [Phytophthora infestans]